MLVVAFVVVGLAPDGEGAIKLFRLVCDEILYEVAQDDRLRAGVAERAAFPQTQHWRGRQSGAGALPLISKSSAPL